MKPFDSPLLIAGSVDNPTSGRGVVWADENGRLNVRKSDGSDVTMATSADLAAATLGLWDDRGSYDASSNLFPSSGGSGDAGAILKGDIWTVSVPGALGGVAVEAGDTVRALVDTPGQTAGNWSVLQNNLGYVPLNPANNLSDLANAATARGNLGGTMVGQAFFTLTNPSAVRFPRINADNSVSARSAADFADDIGLGATDSVTFGRVSLSSSDALVTAHSTMGTTETFDASVSDVHSGTLDQNCTFTLSNPSSSGRQTSLVLHILQDGTGGYTITWPGSVVADPAEPAVVTTADTLTIYVLTTIDGGTTWVRSIVATGVA